MIYSEKQVRELEEKYKSEIRKLKKENEQKELENKLLKKENKNNKEIIHDLDKNNYRSQCETLRLENRELKKTENIRRKIQSCENQLRKRQQQ